MQKTSKENELFPNPAKTASPADLQPAVKLLSGSGPTDHIIKL